MGKNNPNKHHAPATAAPPAKAAPEPANENLSGMSEHEFEQKLMQLKADLHGGNRLPTLEEMLADSAHASQAEDTDLPQQVEALKKDNERLRQIVEQARQRVQQAEKDAELWQAREKEYENMLEEKSELIRQLNQQLRAQPVAQKDGPSEDELVALHQELQRERQIMEDDRAALEEQFRTLELQMAKERADIAKQRSEVQRLQAEFKRQMDILERESKVRGDMGEFIRLREEIQSIQSGGRPASRPTPAPGSSPTPVPQQPIPQIDRKAPESDQGVSRKSFFGGLFRRGDT